MISILQAVQNLRPGTSWNMRGNVLEQANDGAARVTVPTDAEIQAYIKSNPDPMDLAKQVLKNSTASPNSRIDALVQILGL